MLNKIYRGGVHRTTPETQEGAPQTAGTPMLPGTAVSNSASTAGSFIRSVSGIRDFFYIVGEPLHGGVDTDYAGTETSIRAYVPRSGDLYAVRAAAGMTLVDGMPLTINGAGRFAPATPASGETPASRVDAYVHFPADSSLRVDFPSGTTANDDLIPIQIK